ncbi:MAG: UDP-N-acetylmuramoyl-tripeptide--D-alanyl-D-alanine ligase [Parachlamydiaceae bacterium]
MHAMTLTEVANILQCFDSFPSSPILGYSIDSRSIKEGELFFCIKGEKVDGHAFLQDVQKRGALAAVVSDHYQGDSFGLPLIRVEDPLFALHDLAKTVVKNSRARVVAITGSLGKTSTKEFTKTILSSKYRVFATPGNHNSQVGLPLAILNHSDGTEEIFVLEMAMSLPGQIAQLVQIAPPEVALITTVALVHACNFDSIEAIACAKGEIFSHPNTCLGIFDRDICNGDELCRIGSSRKISFSTTSSDADYYLDVVDPPKIYSKLEARDVHLEKLPFHGKHNYHNLLASILVGRHFNVDWDEINQAIGSMLLPEKRLQFILHRDILFLNDSYNASELSVKAALESLPQPTVEGRKIAVLGSMLELGQFSCDCHRRVAEFALNHVDHMYCLGEECLPIYDVWKRAGRPVELFEDRAHLVACLKKDLKPSDVVLLKGSRSKELWKVLDEI